MSDRFGLSEWEAPLPWGDSAVMSHFAPETAIKRANLTSHSAPNDVIDIGNRFILTFSSGRKEIAYRRNYDVDIRGDANQCYSQCQSERDRRSRRTIGLLSDILHDGTPCESTITVPKF
jgi:hypothetical protein